jgi:serine/threonine-protein kinase
MNEGEPIIYAFENLRLNPAKRLLFNADGDPVPLTPKALDILIYLVRNAERVVSKDELMSAIWPDTVVEENSLTQSVSTLRRVLGEKHREHRFIATVPGRGYKFVAEVRQIAGMADSAATTQSAVADSRPEAGEGAESAQHRALSGRRGRLFGRAALASGLALGLVWLVFLGWPGAAGRSPDSPIGSVAVLPFRPLTAEHRNEMMELGMADSLIAKLSESERLVVRPLSAVRSFVALDQDPLAAGRVLAVEAVLDGSIQVSEDRMRVSARLLRVSDGRQLWAEQFDEKRTDVFGVQDAITEKVAAALSVRLSGRRHPETTNFEAYEQYMLGRLYSLKLVRSEVDKGILHFERAIEIDPNYALGYVGIAEAQFPLVMSNDVDPLSVFPQARRVAFRAVELNPNLADAQLALGMIAFWYDWDWPEAERRFVRALDLNPNNSRARSMYAHLLSNTGRHDRALAEARRARELDPASVFGRSIEGLFLQQARQTEAAVEHLRGAVDLEPMFWLSHHLLSASLIENRRYEEAVYEADVARKLSPLQTHSVAFRGVALAAHGRTAQARVVLDELLQASRERYVPPTNIGMLYAALGEKERALEQLEKAFAEKDVRMVFMKVEPRWDSLRSDARFVELMKRMNFY